MVHPLYRRGAHGRRHLPHGARPEQLGRAGLHAARHAEGPDAHPRIGLSELGRARHLQVVQGLSEQRLALPDVGGPAGRGLYARDGEAAAPEAGRNRTLLPGRGAASDGCRPAGRGCRGARKGHLGLRNGRVRQQDPALLRHSAAHLRHEGRVPELPTRHSSGITRPTLRTVPTRSSSTSTRCRRSWR